MFLSIAVAGLLGPAAPVQTPTPVSIEWSAPAGCPEAPAIRGWVEALTGAEVGPAEEGETHAVGAVRAVAAGFELQLDIEGPAGASSRVLDASDCNVLGRAAAVVIGVALDPLAVVARTQPTEAATTREPGPPPPVSLLPAEPVPMTPRSAPKPQSVAPLREDEASAPLDAWRPAIEAGARIGVGVAGRVLPGAGLATEASVFFGVPRVHGRALLQFRPERERQLSDNTRAGAGFRLTAGGLRLCPQLLPTKRLRVPLCTGVDLGAVRGAGLGDALASSRQVRSFWAAVAVQPGLELAVVSWLSVVVDAELAISLSRPRFFLDNGGALHETARLAPRGMLGVQFHRPRVLP